MPDVTITLTTDEALALTARVEQWQQSQPETNWTPTLVLQTMVVTDLQSALREMDKRLEPVASMAKQLTRAQFLPLIETLTGAQKARFRALMGE